MRLRNESTINCVLGNNRAVRSCRSLYSSGGDEAAGEGAGCRRVRGVRRRRYFGPGIYSATTAAQRLLARAACTLRNTIVFYAYWTHPHSYTMRICRQDRSVSTRLLHNTYASVLMHHLIKPLKHRKLYF